jgi:hypothetical protein
VAVEEWIPIDKKDLSSVVDRMDANVFPAGKIISGKTGIPQAGLY